MSINKTQVPLILGVIYRFSKWILQKLRTFYRDMALVLLEGHIPVLGVLGTGWFLIACLFRGVFLYQEVTVGV